MSRQYQISKHLVLKAWKIVRANQGSAGVDGIDLVIFENNLKGNLFKIWNRMSSGSYHPKAVRLVEIPKKSGGKRKLGIPTVADRVAQTVVKLLIEPEFEKFFHESSFGYRPQRSALDAVAKARARCWEKDWVVDVDIKGFFDNIDHDLLMKALRKHVHDEWIILYVERWLKAPVAGPDGIEVKREKGTPQGGVISPILANLFLHYAFDCWIERECIGVGFERYADDIVIHCQSRKQADHILQKLSARLKSCNLELNSEKTRIVRLRKPRRPGVANDDTKVKPFDFLGFQFRPRMARRKFGEIITDVLPAVSPDAKREIRATIGSWNIQARTFHSAEQIARTINPVVRGWIRYYGAFYKSELIQPLNQIELALVRWLRRKYIKMRRRPWDAIALLDKMREQNPKLFAHWEFGAISKFDYCR